MSERWLKFVMVWAVVLLLSAPLTVAAQSWRLEKGGALKALEPQGPDKYLLAVSEIKKLLEAGRAEAAGKAIEQLKKDFPEIAGKDLDAFFEAEMLFCRGKFVKAVRSYDKFLDEFPKSELFAAALDRQFAIAAAFLAGRKISVLKVFKIRAYAQGEKIMERITDRAGDAPIAVTAAVAAAESLEKRTEFDEAYHKWSQISSQWPSGQTAKEALLAMARCKHASYRGPKYDASGLISAKSYYENFTLRYPQEAKKLQLDRKLEQINEQLAYKQFSVGRYYERTESAVPANLYYQMVKDNWPQTVAARMTEDK